MLSWIKITTEHSRNWPLVLSTHPPSIGVSIVWTIRTWHYLAMSDKWAVIPMNKNVVWICLNSKYDGQWDYQNEKTHDIHLHGKIQGEDDEPLFRQSHMEIWSCWLFHSPSESNLQQISTVLVTLVKDCQLANKTPPRKWMCAAWYVIGSTTNKTWNSLWISFKEVCFHSFILNKHAEDSHHEDHEVVSHCKYKSRLYNCSCWNETRNYRIGVGGYC